MDFKYPEINVSEETFKAMKTENDEHKDGEQEEANFIISGVIIKTFFYCFSSPCFLDETRDKTFSLINSNRRKFPVLGSPQF